MRADFRREHQIVWAHAEAERLGAAFGEAVEVIVHIIENAFTQGERVITVRDPEGRGISGAICLTHRSEEGSLWTAELYPVVDEDSEPVPPTRSIQSLTLQMRYNRCVHATYDRTIGQASGHEGSPDFGEGVGRLLRGEVTVHRRRSLGRGDAVPAYARIVA